MNNVILVSRRNVNAHNILFDWFVWKNIDTRLRLEVALAESSYSAKLIRSQVLILLLLRFGFVFDFLGLVFFVVQWESIHPTNHGILGRTRETALRVLLHIYILVWIVSSFLLWSRELHVMISSRIYVWCAKAEFTPTLDNYYVRWWFFFNFIIVVIIILFFEYTNLLRWTFYGVTGTLSNTRLKIVWILWRNALLILKDSVLIVIF